MNLYEGAATLVSAPAVPSAVPSLMLRSRPRRGIIPTGQEEHMASLSKEFEKCRQYLTGVKGYAASSLDNYTRTWQQFAHWLVAVKGLTDESKHFTNERVMEWCQWLADEGWNPNTILNKIHALSTLAKFLLKRRDARGRPLLLSNPTVGFERPQQRPVETKFLLPQEVPVFLAAPCSPSIHLARMLFLDTGLRCLEVCEANVGDLRKMGEDWYLLLKVKGRRWEGSEPANIPVSEPVAEALTRAVLARAPIRGERQVGPTAPLLVDETGQRFRRSQLSQAMIDLGRRAGLTRISTSPHKLRHTVNVVARLSGIDKTVRIKMLNHRSSKAIERYEHLVPGETARGRAQQVAGFERYLRLDTTNPTAKLPETLAADERSAP